MPIAEELNMSKEASPLAEVSNQFNRVRWHDSKFFSLELLPDENEETYSLRLNVKLITNTQGGEDEWVDKKLIFRECRIVRLDLDLLAMQFIGGDIASAVCETEAGSREKTERDKIKDFDLPQKDNSLDDLLFFKITFIHPGGELIAFAKSFELV